MGSLPESKFAPKGKVTTQLPVENPQRLSELLQNLDNQRCHKSLKYLKDIQTHCIRCQMLPESKFSNSKGSVRNDPPVENPEALSALLPA